MKDQLVQPGETHNTWRWRPRSRTCCKSTDPCMGRRDFAYILEPFISDHNDIESYSFSRQMLKENPGEIEKHLMDLLKKHGVEQMDYVLVKIT